MLCVKITFSLLFCMCVCLKRKKNYKKKKREGKEESTGTQSISPHWLSNGLLMGSNKRFEPFMNPITYNKGFGLVGSEEYFWIQYTCKIVIWKTDRKWRLKVFKGPRNKSLSNGGDISISGSMKSSSQYLGLMAKMAHYHYLAKKIAICHYFENM